MFKEFFDKLDDDELRCIVSKTNIPIDGYRSSSNNIPRQKLKLGIINFLNKYKSKIFIKDINDYLNLQRKNVHTFNLQILHDLYNNEHIEIVEDVLKFLNSNSELNKENNELNKKWKDCLRQLKQKQEELTVRKHEYFSEKSKLEKRIENLNKTIEENMIEIKTFNEKNFEYEKRIEELNVTVEGNKLDNQKLQKENSEYKIKIMEITKQNEYYKKMILLHKIILFKLLPNDEKIFPYTYLTINNTKELQEVLLNKEFSEIWYLERFLNPFEANSLLNITRKSNIKIRPIDSEYLELFNLGVRL